MLLDNEMLLDIWIVVIPVVMVLLLFGGTICVLGTRNTRWGPKIRWALLSIIPAFVTLNYVYFRNLSPEDSDNPVAGLFLTLLFFSALAMNWIIYGFFRRKQRVLDQDDVARSA